MTAPRMPAPTPPPSIGRFRILEEIGRGGMGVVYRAIDRNTGDVRAIKVLLAAEHAGDDAVQRFAREAEAARKVQHPNVVTVYELGWHQGRPFLTMDLVDGGSIDRLSSAPFDLQRFARIMAGVAEGLNAAHAVGLVHRDVKPENILLDGDHARITDFGLAHDMRQRAPRLTATGQVLGTPCYMAPEQATNTSSPGALSDQYSVGAVLYELVAGRPPYGGDSAVQVMLMLATEPPTPLAKAAPHAPAPLIRIIEKAMSRQPERRYTSCHEMAQDLRRFASGTPVYAQAPSPWTRLTDRVGPLGRSSVYVGLVVALGMMGWGGYATWHNASIQADELDRQISADRALAQLEAQIAALPENDDSAIVRLQAFAHLHRGTAAATDALLRSAARHADRNDSRGQFASLAEAYSSADHPEDQDRVLAALAAAMELKWDWLGLAAVTSTQARRHPARQDAATIAGPRATTLLATGKGAAAAEAFRTLGRLDAASLAHTFSTSSPGPAGLRHSEAVDWDGDGILETVAWRADGMHIVEIRPGFPTEAVLPMDGATQAKDVRAILLRGTSRRWIFYTNAQLSLMQLEASGPRVLGQQPSSPPLSAVAVDLNSDGKDEVYVGIGPYERRLLVATEASQWAFEDAHPATTRAASDVVDLAVIDTPSGKELWAAVGPWAAYDVRRFAAREDELVLLDRQRLGYVSTILGLANGTVLALHGPRYPSLEVFPKGSPTGPETGVWWIDPASPNDPKLTPFDGPIGDLQGALEGDVNGDGRPDLVINASSSDERNAMMVLLGTEQGWSSPYVLTLGSAVLLAQLDDDPALEVVVKNQKDNSDETRIWGLTTGESPDVDFQLVSPKEVPAGLPKAGRLAWQRAEDLVIMGLTRDAAQAFQRLANGLPADQRDQVQQRTATLLGALGDAEEAARVWTTLAPHDDDARSKAAKAWTHAHRFPEAADHGQVAAWLGDDTPWLLVDGPVHHPAFGILDPEMVHTDATGLRFQAVAGGPPLAAVSVPWDGQHLSVEYTILVDRLEWGAGIEVQILGVGGPTGLWGWGGGRILEREAACRTTASRLQGAVTGADVHERWTLRLDIADGEAHCQVDGPAGRRSASRPFDVGAPETLQILLRPASHTNHTSMLASGVIEKLEVRATHGSPAISATTLPQATPPPKTDNDLRAMLRDDPERLHALIRATPATLVPRLAATMGLDALEPFAEAHKALWHAHPDDPTTHRVFTVYAAPLLALDTTRASVAQQHHLARLLAGRGAAWRALGDISAAKNDLSRAYELLAVLPEAEPLDRVAVCIELAALNAEGAPELARQFAQEAIDRHPVPELAGDKLAARPELAALMEGLRAP